MSFDPRVTPARSDLAAAHLRGRVEAEKFSEGERKRVIGSLTPVRQEPAHYAPLLTEALHGEFVRVYETTDEGWCWGQLERDGYVGWMPANDLIAAAGDAPTHRVCVPRGFIFSEADIKSAPLLALPFGAQVSVERTQQKFLIAENGFIPAIFLKEIRERDADFVGTARRFLNAPYLWGGKSSLGIDCSGLVQVSLQAAGIECPRDSDMQAKLGEAVRADFSSLKRGDLVCWKGHIGIVSDPGRLLHANAFHMQVVEEPLKEAVERIGKTGSEVTGVRRVI